MHTRPKLSILAAWAIAAAGCTGSLKVEPPGDGSMQARDGALARSDSGPGSADSGPAQRPDGAPVGTDAGPMGVDAGPACPTGRTSCGGNCVNLQTNKNHCGRCSRACAAGQTCSSGTCVASTSCPAPPSGASADAKAAYQLENQVRTAMGVPCARMVTTANTSARRHCAYYVANSGMCIADPHVEVSGCSRYVAAQFYQRMTAAGYTGSPAAEDMDFVGNGAMAVQQFIDSVWHRTPILSPWIRDMGYGKATGCDTIDFGVGAATAANVTATYPYANQTGVPTSFNGRYEGPMPPVPPAGWPSGYPITIYLDGSVSQHVLTVDGSSTSIAHQWLTPSNQALLMGQRAFIMYANTPLSSATTYHVHVQGSRPSGAAVTLDWTFTTR